MIDSPSYLLLKMHCDGEDTIVLRVPTFWDATEEQWTGAIQTPITKTLITATGKDSFELQNNFNIVLKKKLENSKIKKEIFSMFKKEKISK